MLGRYLEGASISTLIVGGYATIHEIFDRKEAIKTIAFMNSITVLAPSLGPLLGALKEHRKCDAPRVAAGPGVEPLGEIQGSRHGVKSFVGAYTHSAALV